MFGKNQTYEIAAQCDNCGQKVCLLIPKGLSIEEHLNAKRGLCPNCGCPIPYES